MEQKIEVNINFLKRGVLKVEIPADIDSKNIEEYCQNILDNSSDKEIINSMKDSDTDIFGSYFDASNIVVEAVENINDDFNELFKTKLWDAFMGRNTSILELSKKSVVEDFGINCIDILEGIGANFSSNDSNILVYSINELKKTLNPDLENGYKDSFETEWSSFVNFIISTEAKYLFIDMEI